MAEAENPKPKRTRRPRVKPARDATRQTIAWWPLAQLRRNPRNARTHDDAQIDDIRGLIRRFGWTQPILATSDGLIIAGHGRFEAAEREGLPTAKVLVVDGWSDEDIRAYMLADNAIAVRAGWDEALLKIELGELQELNIDVSGLGFTEDQLRELDALGQGPDAPDQFPSYGDDIETEHRCPRCGYEWSGKPKGGNAAVADPAGEPDEE